MKPESRDRVARDLQTGRDREIYRTKARVLDGTAISPDGRNLAVVVVPELNNGEGSLMIVPVSGGAPREVYHKVADIGRPPLAWTRDGRHVLAFHMARGVFSSFPANGGAPEESPLPARIKGRLGLGGAAPAVSPDGSQIAFVGASQAGQLWALSDLLPDSKKAVPR